MSEASAGVGLETKVGKCKKCGGAVSMDIPGTVCPDCGGQPIASSAKFTGAAQDCTPPGGQASDATPRGEGGNASPNARNRTAIEEESVMKEKTDAEDNRGKDSALTDEQTPGKADSGNGGTNTVQENRENSSGNVPMNQMKGTGPNGNQQNPPQGIGGNGNGQQGDAGNTDGQQSGTGNRDGQQGGGGDGNWQQGGGGSRDGQQGGAGNRDGQQGGGGNRGGQQGGGGNRDGQQGGAGNRGGQQGGGGNRGGQQGVGGNRGGQQAGAENMGGQQAGAGNRDGQQGGAGNRGGQQGGGGNRDGQQGVGGNRSGQQGGGGNRDGQQGGAGNRDGQQGGAGNRDGQQGGGGNRGGQQGGAGNRGGQQGGGGNRDGQQGGGGNRGGQQGGAGNRGGQQGGGGNRDGQQGGAGNRDGQQGGDTVTLKPVGDRVASTSRLTSDASPGDNKSMSTGSDSGQKEVTKTGQEQRKATYFQQKLYASTIVNALFHPGPGGPSSEKKQLDQNPPQTQTKSYASAASAVIDKTQNPTTVSVELKAAAPANSPQPVREYLYLCSCTPRIL